VFAGTAAVLGEGVGEVVAVLAANARVARVKWLIAVGAVAVKTGLAGGAAFEVGRLFACGGIAFGQARRG